MVNVNNVVNMDSVECNMFRSIDLSLDDVQMEKIGMVHSSELSLSELLDMNYQEMQSIVGMSCVDVIRFVDHAIQSFCISSSCQQEARSRCAQHFPGNKCTEHDGMIQVTEQGTISALIACLKESNRTLNVLENLPDLSVAYSVPDATSLYHSRNWFVSVIALEKFRGEQHYNQRRALQELLLMMRRYGGDRGLVEPVFVYHPRNSSLYETLHHHDPALLLRLSMHNASEQIVWNNSVLSTGFGVFAAPAGRLLDMPTLARALRSDILPYHSFRALSRHTLDELLVTDSSLTGRQPQLSCAAPGGPAAAELLGAEWNVTAFRCLADACVEPALGRAIAESPAKALAVAHSRTRLCRPGPANSGRKPVYQWADPAFEYLRTRAFLRFSREVVAHALGFVRAELDGQPFLGVHWRRGDRLVFGSWGLSVDPGTLVARIVETCAALDLVDVYLMTNCGLESDVALVVGSLAAYGVAARRLAAFPGWWEEDRRLAVESSVMSFAEYVLTSSSAVSSGVLEERVLLGWDPGSWENLAEDDGYAVLGRGERYLRAMPCLRVMPCWRVRLSEPNQARVPSRAPARSILSQVKHVSSSVPVSGDGYAVQ
jgi:hypothetical protein